MLNIFVTFIGGPADGDRRAVQSHGAAQEPAPLFLVEECDPIAPTWASSEYADCAGKTKQHVYQREIISSQRGRHRWAYVHESMRGSDLLDVLLAGYRRPVEA